MISADSEQLDRRGRSMVKLQLQTAPEQIVDRILTAIAVGVLCPGERLPPERELAEMLGVARNTVRQALARLDALGVLEVRRGRHGGRFVRPLTPDSHATLSVLRTLGPIWGDIEALLDYRSLIEQQITRTAAERRTAADATALEAALVRYRRADSAQTSREADRALHRAIATAAGNPYLAQLSRELVARVNLGFSADPFSGRLRTRALEQHARMVRAIVDGDGDRAAAVAREHFEATTVEPWRSVRDAVESPHGLDAADDELTERA